MNALLPSDAPHALNPPPRARGELRVSAKRRGALSVIDGLRQSGASKLLFPQTNDDALQAVMINTAGGITGGDRFEVAATAHAGTTLTLTTQTAERAYRALPQQIGRITSRLKIDAGATLRWLPQETILFDGCALHRRMQIDMAATAQLLFVEPLVFGRKAMGEALETGQFHDRIDLRRAGAPLFSDATQLDGAIARQLTAPAMAQGAGAAVSLLYVAPDARRHLNAIRALLPATAGASLIREDVLFLRGVAPDSFDVRAFLIPILNRLTANTLPRPWMI